MMSLRNSTFQKTKTYEQACSVKRLMIFLHEVYGAVGDYVKDDAGVVKSLFFQDSSMKDMFNFYSDRICIDCTFKRFEIDMFLYLFLCQDSNGRNYIIAVGFLQKNDADSYLWLFDAFKRHNPNWRRIRSIALDPKMNCWILIRESFSEPLIVHCFYHALTSFKDGLIDCENISDEDKTSASNLFKSLCYSTTNLEFEQHYQQYLKLPIPLVSYLHEIWMPKKREWRIPLEYTHENIFCTLNIYLYELNNHIQTAIVAENNYIEFIKKIFSLIVLKKREKSILISEPISLLYSRFSPEYQISKALTPYAAKFVIDQLHMMADTTKGFEFVLGSYFFDYLGSSVSTSPTSCSCDFFLLTLLPCRHIFSVRKLNDLCIFDETLVDYTWNIKYYQHTLPSLQNYSAKNKDIDIPQGFCTTRQELLSCYEEIKNSIPLQEMNSAIKVPPFSEERNYSNEKPDPGPSRICHQSGRKCVEGSRNKKLPRCDDGVTCSCRELGRKRGMFFEISNMDDRKIMTFACLWLKKCSKNQIMSEISICSCKFDEWDKRQRRICELSVNNGIPMEDQEGTSDYRDPLDVWLEKHDGQDPFLAFIKDSSRVHIMEELC